MSELGPRRGSVGSDQREASLGGARGNWAGLKASRVVAGTEKEWLAPGKAEETLCLAVS